MDKKTDRAALLLESLRVDRSEVKWFFIVDYYDGPISGLVRFRGTVYRFCCFPEDIPQHRVYVLQSLSEVELTEELRLKREFESNVGTHWSFDDDGSPMPDVRGKQEHSARYYAEHTPFPNPDPRDRPVAAWFEV